MTAERERALYVYWCPICEIQTDRPWHIAQRGDPLIPQNDVEHHCDRVEVVRGDALASAAAETDSLRLALEAARHNHRADNKYLIGKFDQAAAEAERLREALRDVDSFLMDPAGNPLDAINFAHGVIREALAVPQADTETA